MAYSPYNELKTVYDAKVAWGNATTDEERKKQEQIANAARETLKANRYGYLADQVSAAGADATAAKKILDAWAPKVDTTTGNFKTGVDNPAYNQVINAASTKNDTLFNTSVDDHAKTNSKYHDLYSYANSDVTQSDEYKSAFANVMPSYNIAAMQGRDNEVASGGASNGGNIDSFSAANAMRQQAALTAKGQALAHQMGLEAYNSRIANARGILSDLGVYNNSIYSTMDKSVNNDVTIANSIFNNEQTAKNNQVQNDIMLSETAGELTSGILYQLPEYSQFFNPDGTLKNPDIDYKAEAEKADKAGNTKLAEALRAARGTKIWSDYKTWGQFDDGDYTLLGSKPTASMVQFKEQLAQADRLAGAESTEKEKDRQHELNKIATANALGVTSDGKVTQQNEDALKLDIDSTISNWLYSPYADLSKTGIYKNGDPDVHVVYYAAQKINDAEVLKDIKKNLASAGYTADQVTKKIAEYRDNIAKQILKAEGIPTTAEDYKERLAATKEKHNLN